MNEILDKVNQIHDKSVRIDYKNDRMPPELQKQLVDLDDVDWLVDTIKELLYEKSQEKLNACTN